METLNLINGNNQMYSLGLPKLVYLTEYINDRALKYIEENSGLKFIKIHFGYEAQPKESKEIVKLLLTYNFKTRYYNNATHKNTLFLKSDHHVGFDVESICFDCVEHNNIVANGLRKESRLSC